MLCVAFGCPAATKEVCKKKKERANGFMRGRDKLYLVYFCLLAERRQLDYIITCTNYPGSREVWAHVREYTRVLGYTKILLVV